MTAKSRAYNFAYLCNSYNRTDAACIEYINKYDDFYSEIYQGWNSLMNACNNNLELTALQLIQLGVNVNYVSPSGYTALYLAVAYDMQNVIKKMIEMNVDVNIIGKNILMPLQNAYIWGYEDIAIMLIKAGTNFTDHIDGIIRHERKQIMQCIRDIYRLRIISVINAKRTDTTDNNAMAISFRTIYATGVVDMIAEFII
ncbi:MAG: hypothetical protein Faunusvirus2_17 [Faunusvirus sp.]|jgi:ankyrin repeat protein|uniref:Uncharacterized protein n=1 Tax=Faunusvirus sp. TaxID=2487766 RepID=A0A3G4ZW40_9VIRU|nr:MAG: hypothetical protein Faunusvirus2_17 [Faunusvirus sp.]